MKNTSQARSNSGKTALHPQAETSASLEDIRGALRDAADCLFDTVRATEALKLLMFVVIENDKSELFTIDSGYLAAGLQTLIWENKHNLELANNMYLDVLNKLP